jgi:hypothetical protein
MLPRPKLFVLTRRLQEQRPQSQEISCVQVPVKISVAQKKSTTEELHKEQNCFGEKIAGTNVTNMKYVQGLSLSRDDVFRDDNNKFI